MTQLAHNLRLARLWVAGAEPSKEGRRIAQAFLDAEEGRQYHMDQINRLARAMGRLGEDSATIIAVAIHLIETRHAAADEGGKQK